MKRILLRELLSNFTEQAPQPPQGGAPEPAPAPGTPPAGESPTPDAPAPTGDAAPAPEQAGEYDFTKDFKEFEATTEKAKQDAKKKFLDVMNTKVKGKKVTVNASRGYGQPQKDYTINKVIKASVDWYYNKNVVVLTDENNKEFFLTPGVNVKVESQAATPEEPQAQGQDQAPEEPPKMVAPPAAEPPAGDKQPGGTPPGAGGPPPPAQKPGQEPAPGGPPTKPAPQPKAAAQPQEDPLAAKKKKPAPTVEEEALGGSKPMTAEDVKDISNLIYEFIPDDVKDSLGRRFDARKYFKTGTRTGPNEDGGWSAEYTLEIPVEIFNGELDVREFKLEANDKLRNYGGPGQAFTRGGVDVTKHGRFYVFEFYESGGLDI